MTVDELRSELQNRGLAPQGNTKPDLQAALLTAIRESPVIRITAEAEQDKVFLDPGSNPDILQIQLKKMEMEEARTRLHIETEERRKKMRIDLELQKHRQEIEQQKRQRQQEMELEDRRMKHELEMKRLEFSTSVAPSVDNRPQASGFRVDTAVKLIPKFNEHDVESFLLSFEKIAQLNSFPEDKYAAILQAHLTGKALKVFTLSLIHISEPTRPY